MTPLHLAAERARVEVIEYLVGKEANIINVQDLNGVNTFMCKCINDTQCVLILGFKIKDLLAAGLWRLMPL